MPQERNIFKSLTVHENLTAVARPGRGRRSASTRCSRGWPSARPTSARSCRAASSRCSRWAARWSLNPRLLLLDEPLEGLAPIIVAELLRAIARITRDEGLSAIIVEQHPQAILAISHRAVVLDHGTVVHAGTAARSARRAELLDRLLGVAR